MDCLFCKIAAGEIPSNKVYEDDHVFAFRDINPVAPTHILVVPKKHISTTNEIGAGDQELVGRMVTTATRLAKDEGLGERGYRLVMNCNEDAGQAVFHIHLHLLGGRSFTWPPG